MEDLRGESAPPSIKRSRAYQREVSEFVCRDTTKYLKRIALKCQVLADREGGTECVEYITMKWKDKDAIFKDMEGPATHPLNRDGSETEMAEGVDEW